MIKRYPYDALGTADYGWLKAHYHFSFSHYYNKTRMGFGVLRVINDDSVMPGKGFDTHPHNNMEIITYVRKGAITHKDSMGNVGITKAGDIQVMSAGSGITHSEYNRADEETNLYQIWIVPNQRNVTPRWETKAFPKAPVKDALPLLVSGDGKAPLSIHQQASIYGGRLDKGTTLIHPIKHQAYVLVSEGEVDVDGQLLQKGDGAEITEQDTVHIAAKMNTELLIIHVPKE